MFTGGTYFILLYYLPLFFSLDLTNANVLFIVLLTKGFLIEKYECKYAYIFYSLTRI